MQKTPHCDCQAEIPAIKQNIQTILNFLRQLTEEVGEILQWLRENEMEEEDQSYDASLDEDTDLDLSDPE